MTDKLVIKTSKRELVYIDFIRIIACYFVIFNHTNGYHFFMYERYNSKIWIHLFFSMIAKFSVPAFFMISGALLLDKSETIGVIYKKRILKIVYVLFFVCGVAYIKAAKNNGGSVKGFILAVIAGGFSKSYWYLYAYIGMLSMLPFLRAMVKNLKEKDYIYLLFMYFVFCSFLPIMSLYVDGFMISGYFSIPIITTNCIFYTLIGYWIENIFDINVLSRMKCMAIILIATLCIYIESYLTLRWGNSGEYTQSYTQLFDYVVAIAVFMLTKYFFEKVKVNIVLKKLITYVGGLTLGIYVLEPRLKPIINTYYNFDSIGLFKGSFVYCIVAMIICGGVTAILKLLPITRKIF